MQETESILDYQTSTNGPESSSIVQSPRSTFIDLTEDKSLHTTLEPSSVDTSKPFSRITKQKPDTDSTASQKDIVPNFIQDLVMEQKKLICSASYSFALAQEETELKDTLQRMLRDPEYVNLFPKESGSAKLPILKYSNSQIEANWSHPSFREELLEFVRRGKVKEIHYVAEPSLYVCSYCNNAPLVRSKLQLE